MGTSSCTLAPGVVESTTTALGSPELLRSLDGRILSTHVQPVKTHDEAFSPASSRRSDRDLATSRVVSNQARNSVQHPRRP